MIIGEHREAVIDNIRQASVTGNLNGKVEVDDPVLTEEQSRAITDRYLNNRKRLTFRMKQFAARQVAQVATALINRDTEVVGLENAVGVNGGAVITSNHFSPLENTAVRYAVNQMGKHRLTIVSQVSNLAMTGAIGFLMNYADIVPISDNFHYIKHGFVPVLTEAFAKNNIVLIYPEQEMWFNYRKPRPFKRGAYYYAAQFGVPILSCFVEMQELPEMDTPAFHKIRYVVHVLKTLYPDPALTVKENSIRLCREDYEQKKAAYERCYGKPLDYSFNPEDIAGWTGGRT